MLFSACANVPRTENREEEEIKTEEKKDTIKIEKDEEKHVEKVKLVDFDTDIDESLIYPEYKESDVKANVPPYEIMKGLKNVDGADDVKFVYSEKAQDALLKDGFVVNYSVMNQPFAIYETNQYTYQSSFVTTDSVMHLYHIIYLGMLEQIEKNYLSEKLMSVTNKMYDKLLKEYNASDEDFKAAQQSNLILFAIAKTLFGEEVEDFPEELQKKMQMELANIESEQPAQSVITGKVIDYSQFKPRGNYTKSEELKKYFRVNMLFSQDAYTLRDANNTLYKGEILNSLLLTRALYSDEELYRDYIDFYAPISFLVDKAEDNSPLTMYEMLGEVVDNLDIDTIRDDKTVESIAEKIAALPTPLINKKAGTIFAFIPQRAVIDNIWLQNVIDDRDSSERPVASGVDLMGVMGNELADKMVKSNEKNKRWDKFEEKYEETKKLAKLDEKSEKENVYRAWLWMLKANNEIYDDSYPLFMQKEKWQLKNLNSSLASWAQLKHDTILYSKQFGAEMGGFDGEMPTHYVEPNVELYNRLNWIVDFTLANADKYNLLDDDHRNILEQYKDMLEFLIKVSMDELTKETVSKEDNERLDYIGGEMENIFIGFNEAKDGEDYVAPSDRDTTNIADIQRVGNNVVEEPEGHYLEVGSGRFSIIDVVFRLNGKYYIGSGSMMNYYEFLSPERMTDEEFSDKCNGFNLETGEEVEQVNPFFIELFDQRN